VLKGTPWLWRKNPENLTGKETAEIKELQGKPLATARAYQMRLVLQDISRLPDETSARQKMCEWCRWVKMGGPEIPDPDLRENGQSGSDDREPSGGHSRTTNAFLEGRGGGTAVLCREAQSPGLPLGEEPHSHALLHCRQTPAIRRPLTFTSY
jgi:transposase